MERVKTEELLSLKGKTALVTGGAMGIGYGISQRLSEAGASVTIADINADVGMKAAESLPQEKTLFIATDVTDESQIQRAVKRTVKKFGSLDILVNNAGIYNPVRLVREMTLEEWNKFLATNLTSTFLACREAANQMIEQGHGGKIINIGSVDSLKPWAVGLAHYDATKHAILGFSRNLALELAEFGITVNVVAPGDIDTEGSRRDGIIPTDLSSEQIPLGRRGTADDIARVVLSLASPIYDYMTGEIIVVDGGWMLTSKPRGKTTQSSPITSQLRP